MRIGIVSDIHGSYDLLVQAVAEMGPLDYLCHAGDGGREIARWVTATGADVHSVRGNCDLAMHPVEMAFPVPGHRILLTHGHLLGVKTDLLRLAYRARELQTDVVIFGHTHIPYIGVSGGILFINPGSLSAYRCHGYPGYALLELDGHMIHAGLFRLGQGPVDHLVWTGPDRPSGQTPDTPGP